ncbi:YlxM family DNA-binding protein [Acetonema longum]|uniref:UPF0122 protein ALO_04336 n=1 Tax=Acetonema longum DSM 6540 TaxID=1009370 RepID=F7NFN8_9FIRM|nr:YlxM family DNA-binding protein [Acetonema longum]EGO65161.1 putative DNA-binding protein [Acetonema longum DSM 6540]
MLDRMLLIGSLYDFYGALLTEKQQLYIRLHYLNDLSLAEIADQFGVSRQSVHDILQRAEQVLLDYEKKLKLVERFHHEQELLSQIHESLVNISGTEPQPRLREIIRVVESLLDYERGIGGKEPARNGF